MNKKKLDKTPVSSEKKVSRTEEVGHNPHRRRMIQSVGTLAIALPFIAHAQTATTARPTTSANTNTNTNTNSNTKRMKVWKLLNLDRTYKRKEMRIEETFNYLRGRLKDEKLAEKHLTPVNAKKFVDSDMLLEIATYEKYYTEAEVDQLIKFYETDIGKKLALQQLTPNELKKNPEKDPLNMFTREILALAREEAKKVKK